MLNACGWNRTSQTTASQKGADCTPLKLPKFYISAVSAVVEPHARSVTDA